MNDQPQVILQGEHLITEQNIEVIASGLSSFCGRLRALNRDLTNRQVLFPLACELYRNLGKAVFAHEGNYEKIKEVEEENQVGYFVVGTRVKDQYAPHNDNQFETQEVLAMCIHDKTKFDLSGVDFTKNQVPFQNVHAKGLILLSYHNIIPAHFLNILIHDTGMTLQEDGVTIILLVDDNDNMEVAPLANKEIFERVEQYRSSFRG